MFALFRVETSEGPEGGKRLGADVMLDPLRVVTGDVGAYAKRKQKSFDHAMSLTGLGRQLLAHRCQEHTSIRLLQDKPILGQPLEHFCNGWLSNAEAFRDVDLPGFTTRGKEIVDQLDVVFHKFQAPRSPVLPEALRLDVGGDQGVRFGLSMFWHDQTPARLLGLA